MSDTSSPALPVTVPLYPQAISDTAYKVGIYLGFAPDSFRLYEFDTGGVGFWSGYSDQWWPKISSTAAPVTNHYASGTTYTAQPVQATVYFADASQTSSALQVTATVAQITSASGGHAADWQNSIDNGKPPLFHAFYGDFGASMLSKEGLGNVMLPPNGSANGFAVTLGAHPQGQGTTTGSLQIGLTDSDLAAATNRIPLVDQPKGPYGQGVLYLDGTPINASGGTAGGGEPAPVDVLFDSGAPVTHIWTGSALTENALAPYVEAGKKGKGTVKENVHLQLVSGGVTILDFVTAAGQVVVSPVPANEDNPALLAGYVNTGIQPFFGRTITFYPGSGGDGFIALEPPVTPGS